MMALYFDFEIKPGDLYGGRPKKGDITKIFIAYSFRSSKSEHFRLELEQKLRRCSALGPVLIRDGKTDAGDHWPTEVRSRLSDSDIVVADLSTLSPDVIFECGFAWALGRRILPVTDKKIVRYSLPRWLTDIQFADYESPDGWDHLVDSVVKHAKRRGQHEFQYTTGTVPGRVVFLKGITEFNRKIFSTIDDKLRQLSAKTRLEYSSEHIILIDKLESVKDEEVTLASQASLIIAPIDGSTGDNIVFFLGGVVTAAPQSGATRRKLPRWILLIGESEESLEKLVPDSLRRAKENAFLLPEKELENKLISYGEIYQRWYDNESGKGKVNAPPRS